MRDASRDDDEQDPDASGSSSRRRLMRSPSVASTPEDTGRPQGPDGRGGGGDSGSSTAKDKVTAHELQTMMRHMSTENSIAQGKLQEALAHHTAAHQQTVQ